MINEQKLKSKNLSFILGIFIILSLGLQFIFAQDSYGGSKATIVTKKGKELSLEFDYAMVTRKEIGEILEKKTIFKKHTFKMIAGGKFQLAHQDQIPFGTEFGFFWHIPVSDHSDSYSLTLDFTHPINKSNIINEDGTDTKFIEINYEVYEGMGQMTLRTTDGDLPGEYILRLLHKDQLIISKKFTVLEP